MRHARLECLGPNPHNHPAINRRGDGGTERGRKFSKVTQLPRSRTGI